MDPLLISTWNHYQTQSQRVQARRFFPHPNYGILPISIRIPRPANMLWPLEEIKHFLKDNEYSLLAFKPHQDFPAGFGKGTEINSIPLLYGNDWRKPKDLDLIAFHICDWKENKEDKINKINKSKSQRPVAVYSQSQSKNGDTYWLYEQQHVFKATLISQLTEEIQEEYDFQFLVDNIVAIGKSFKETKSENEPLGKGHRKRKRKVTQDQNQNENETSPYCALLAMRGCQKLFIHGLSSKEKALIWVRAVRFTMV